METKTSQDKHLHKWGYSDTEFSIDGNNISLSGDRYLICGYSMPKFMDFIQEELEIEDLDFNQLQKEIPYKISRNVINDSLMG